LAKSQNAPSATETTEGQGPAVPELVTILKRLAAHQRREWEETYDLEGIANRFMAALRADDRDAAANRLCQFVEAAGEKCSDESRQRMLANLDRVMEARRAAQASGGSDFNAIPADLGSEAERAFGVLSRIREEGLLGEKTEAYWRHPLLRACAWLEERLGIGRDLLEIAAGRLNSALGLRGMEPLRGPNGRTSKGAPDCLWMIPKFTEADRDGTTAKLWRTLLDEYPAELVDAGLTPGGVKVRIAANGAQGTRPKTRKKRSDPKADKRIADAWRTGRYKTEAALAKELKLTEREVYLARQRHRKREAAKGKTRRK
jgi:hypothetical protein